MAARDADCIVVGAANICCDDEDLGFTDGGITIRYEPEFFDVTADQAFGTIAKRKIDEKMFVEFELICISLDNIRAAMALPSSNLDMNGGCLLLGYEQATCDDEVTCDLKLYGPGPGCSTRTWHFPCVSPSEGFELSLSRTEAQKLSVTYEVLKIEGGYFGLVCDTAVDVNGCSEVGNIEVVTDVEGNVTAINCIPPTDDPANDTTEPGHTFV